MGKKKYVDKNNKIIEEGKKMKGIYETLLKSCHEPDSTDVKDIRAILERILYATKDINPVLQALELLSQNNVSEIEYNRFLLIFNTFLDLISNFKLDINHSLQIDRIIGKIYFSDLDKNLLDKELLVDTQLAVKKLLKDNACPHISFYGCYDAVDKETLPYADFSFKTLNPNKLFCVRAIDLVPLIFYKKKDAFIITTSSEINYLEELKDAVLLFSYLEDNKCMEFYTGTIVNLESTPHKFEKKDRVVSDLISKLNEIKKYPLSIREYEIASESVLLPADNKYIKEKLMSQEGEKAKQIIQAINKMQKLASESISKEISKIYDEDYEQAKKEYQFDSKVSLFLEKTEKQMLLLKEEKDN